MSSPARAGAAQEPTRTTRAAGRGGLTRVFATSAFRMALGYTALFAVSGMLLLGFVFWTTAGQATRQSDATIEVEIASLGERYRQGGIGGLRQVIEARSQNQRLSLYLLIGPVGQPLAGNLDAWPNANDRSGIDEAGWFEFDFARPVGPTTERHTARARALRLRGGFQLLVGRDIQDQRDLSARIGKSLIWAMVLTLALGLAGGLVMSKRLLRRIEAINTTGRQIMAGDFSQRVPVGTSRDEIDELAAQLNAMLARIEELIAGMKYVSESIAHDLRSPLTRLRQGLEQALSAQNDPEEAAYAVGGAIEECEQLIATFNGLLTIANVESGTGHDVQPVALDDVVADAAELYRPAAEDAGLTFAAEVARGGDLKVSGNRALLNQALANLLDNAIKYTPRGGTVAVMLETDGPETDGPEADGPAIRLVVSDSGPGIPEADRSRVLERFVRLQPARSAEPRGGSGLGLSLVKAVANLHGAVLTLGDNDPGLRVELRFSAVVATS